MISSVIRGYCRAAFGEFEQGELQKFLLLGLMLGLIGGISGILRVMKDAFVPDIIGASFLSHARILSFFMVFPLIMAYSKLVDRFPRHVLFYVVSSLYGFGALVFTWYMLDPVMGLANFKADPSRLLGWAWYVFVESFDIVLLALFWAFAVDTTTPDSAKRGFPLVVLMGLIAKMFWPVWVSSIPKHLEVSNAYMVLVTGLLLLLLIPLVMLFQAKIAPEQMVGYREREQKNENAKTGWMEGFALLLKQPYLLGILGMGMFYVVSMSVFDYYFREMVSATLFDPFERIKYFGQYALYSQLAIFLLILGGSSAIPRKLGVTTSLLLLPLWMGIVVLIGKFYPNLDLLFWGLVVAKGLAVAIELPVRKLLYIPTTRDVRFKSQAWIIGLSSQGSSVAGSALKDFHKELLLKNGPEWGTQTEAGEVVVNRMFARNHMFGELDKGSAIHIALMSYLFFGCVALWIVIALYVGRTYQKTVEEHKVLG